MRTHFILAALVAAFSVSSALAHDLEYFCAMKRKNFSNGHSVDCGVIRINKEVEASQELKQCGVTVFSGSAYGMQCSGLHVLLGTTPGLIGRIMGHGYNRGTSLFICPDDRPERFLMSLLPGGSIDVSMECSISEK